MKAFEVWINGEKKCVAGVAGEALLSSTLTWTRHGLRLHVGGLENEEHLDWLGQECALVKVGDEILFRILETEVVDEPLERQSRQTRAEQEAQVREDLTRARQLLPGFVDESDAANLSIFERHLEQNHLIGAADTLGALGENRDVPADFWSELASACRGLSRYEDCDRYAQKFEEANPTER